jgi:hypothetical protein
MVITSRILQDRLGIDPFIADYFANQRQVPPDNLFWKDKRIYLSMGFGFLTIPFAFDLMHKCGISRDLLLHDDHVALMEQGFDLLKKYELKRITLEEFVAGCKQLLNDKIRQPHLARDLFALFTGEKPTNFRFEISYQALARSDFFLYTLVDIPVSNEWIHQFLPYWYALARPILLLDDFRDIEEDRINGEENTIIELGDDKVAVLKAYEMGKSDLAKLADINQPLSEFIQELLDDSMQYAPIQKMLAD